MSVNKSCLFLLCLIWMNNFPHIVCFTFKASGGYRSDKHNWAKYTASIRKAHLDKRRFGSGHICGGSIISPKTILTAAHCLYSLLVYEESTNNSLNVVVGTKYRMRRNRGTQIIKVSDFVIHPLYNMDDDFYDIGLIMPTFPIDIDGVATDIIPLPHKQPQAGLQCTAAGWGEVYYMGPAADEIVYINLYILSERDCWRSFPYKSDRDVCATDINDIAVDTCKGDSGGPLFCEGVVYGITSRGPKCGKTNSSGLYASVYSYLDWIKENTSNNKLSQSLYIWFIYILLICYWQMYR